ncbi:MAG TPA: hypothetical protein VGO09_09525 [Flavisolibacter sp.]|nr:hypothetical protein [Flavisolibacter sp.]
MRPVKPLMIIILSAILAGCHNSETKINFPGKQDLYFDYKITGAEEQNYVSWGLEYRLGGPEGKGILIDSPGRVMIDGELIPADSTRKSGVYYETVKLMSEVTGKHRIEFINKDLKNYSEEVDFEPFTLQSGLPAEIERHPFNIGLKDFPSSKDNLRLVMIDTSFKSTGINEIVKVYNGTITINQFMLDRLKNGPIILKLYLEEERPIKNAPAGGMLTILYSLERGFNLVD